MKIPEILAAEYTTIDRIDNAGNIREHAVRVGFDSFSSAICGRRLGSQLQRPAGNAECATCERLLESRAMKAEHAAPRQGPHRVRPQRNRVRGSLAPQGKGPPMKLTITAKNPRPCECDPGLAPEGVIDVDITVKISPPLGDVDTLEGGVTLRPVMRETDPVQYGWEPLSHNPEEWISCELLSGLMVCEQVMGLRSGRMCSEGRERMLTEAARLALKDYPHPHARSR